MTQVEERAKAPGHRLGTTVSVADETAMRGRAAARGRRPSPFDYQVVGLPGVKSQTLKKPSRSIPDAASAAAMKSAVETLP